MHKAVDDAAATSTETINKMSICKASFVCVGLCWPDEKSIIHGANQCNFIFSLSCYFVIFCISDNIADLFEKVRFCAAVAPVNVCDPVCVVAVVITVRIYTFSQL